MDKSSSVSKEEQIEETKGGGDTFARDAEQLNVTLGMWGAAPGTSHSVSLTLRSGKLLPQRTEGVIGVASS